MVVLLGFRIKSCFVINTRVIAPHQEQGIRNCRCKDATPECVFMFHGPAGSFHAATSQKHPAFHQLFRASLIYDHRR
jgi:hypothetical protein